MEIPHVYDLLFVDGKPRKANPPELVFCIKNTLLHTLIETVLEVLTRNPRILSEYHWPDSVVFGDGRPDLFGNTVFGFHRCGYVTCRDGEVWLRFPLTPDNAAAVALSIHVLLYSFEMGADGPVSNRVQQTWIRTRADYNGTVGYYHAMGGHLAQSVVAWLRQYRSTSADPGIPPEVMAAMQKTWAATTPKNLLPYVRDCAGRIEDDGAFILQCFGNACDFGIYPDSFRHEELSHVEISCHNLDSSFQQLTFLAGLAKLCELARAGD